MTIYGAIAMLALASHPALAQSGRAERGRHFAQVNCGQCHAIGKVGASPLVVAPPFRDLHLRYPVEDLAESFAEGLVTGHPSMPEIVLDAAQINDFVAYLNSLGH